jgi:ClpX C4-type zinc finger
VSDEDLRARTAFRITINGEPFCEAEHLTTATIAVDEVRGQDEQRITLYANANEGHLQWMTASLGIGDQIVIEVVDALTERESEPQHCDFCGRDAHDVSILVQGQTGSICDQCISGFSTAVHKGSALPVGASFSNDSDSPCRFCGGTTSDHPPWLCVTAQRSAQSACALARTCWEKGPTGVR